MLKLATTLQEHTLLLEEVDVPAAARHRQQVCELAQNSYGDSGNGFSGGSSNKSQCFSVCINFVCTPHVEPLGEKGVLESIIFTNNANGTSFPLPDGHEWCFAAAGHAMPLSSRNCKVYVPNHVWHGTLPTSSKEPTMDHSGVGSAVVVKKESI